MNKKIQSTACLMLTAIIWGMAFVAQRDGMDTMGPFMFSGLRMYLGFLALLPVIIITDKRNKDKLSEKTEEEIALDKKDTIKGGIWCGIIIFFAVSFQQFGLVSVSAGKTAFITTLYIILVPLMGIFLKKKVNAFHISGVALGTAGLYFLCLTEDLSIAFGDLIVLIGAFFWAAHILCIDHYAPKVNVMKLMAIQFIIAATFSTVVSIFTETTTMESIISSAPNLLYTGILSSAVAYTLQAIGQKNANPTTASIILSTEALFGAVCGFLILGEMFSGRELTGCILMFGAVIIAQLPTKEERLQVAEEKAAKANKL